MTNIVKEKNRRLKSMIRAPDPKFYALKAAVSDALDSAAAEQLNIINRLLHPAILKLAFITAAAETAAQDKESSQGLALILDEITASVKAAADGIQEMI